MAKNGIAVWMRKLATLRRLPFFVLCWLVPAWCLLGIGRALVLAVSFRRLAPWLGRQQQAPAPWVPLLSREQERRARLVGRVVRIAARYTPWESNCFPQAIAGRVLLGIYRVPYVLCFGLTKKAGSATPLAHAWVAAGPVPVTGGLSFGRYAVVGVFVSPGLEAR
ncbi:hypothetical protein PIGHUM_02114 [Pigmentiphaga humi]|uniref:Microcin J25-processing protein McjB C-terminal domain-containing protein n=1 Tax=Pigmentiphaga humi TaxID=2478468 RepID=A0A3P4B186_9BURK|nr:lasso peptide biosynthesis B2 protein [Pigmentiphaga humi]VCU70047.1 hypothetical protein PIGHUM_02114 [Pigmentiphaga humi]